LEYARIESLTIISNDQMKYDVWEGFDDNPVPEYTLLDPPPADILYFGNRDNVVRTFNLSYALPRGYAITVQRSK
jgi:hypothetical protein